MFWSYTTATLLGLCGVLLMFVILLQRGRGGGLAGAFGGLGGQSAFGTKAGDVFTRITIGIAVVWVVLASIGGYAMRLAAEGRYEPEPSEEKQLISPDEVEDAKEGDAALLNAKNGIKTEDGTGADSEKAEQPEGGLSAPSIETKEEASSETPQEKASDDSADKPKEEGTSEK